MYAVFEIRGSQLVVLRTTNPKKLVVRTQNQFSKACLTKTTSKTFMSINLIPRNSSREVKDPIHGVECVRGKPRISEREGHMP